MNTEIFYYSIIEIVISLFFGVTLLYFTYRIINKFVKKKFEINFDNVSLFNIYFLYIIFL